MTRGFKMNMSLLPGLLVLLAFGCAREPKLKIADGQTKNLFRKSELAVGPASVEKFAGVNAALTAKAKELEINTIEFQISESYLTVWADSAQSGKALYQFPVEGHFDLTREKDKDGQQNQFLVKSKDVNVQWSARKFVEVDPTALKLIKPTSTDLLTLYEVNLLKSKVFEVGVDAIPGFDERSMKDLAAKHGLAKGDKIKVQLTKAEAIYRKINSNGSTTIIASLRTDYVDLVRSKNDKDELTHKFERSSKERSWDKRQFVSLSPDSLEIATNDIGLASKESLEGCRKLSDVSVPEIRDTLLNKPLGLTQDSEVCIEVSQTTLAVCKGTCAVPRNLLATWTIIDHLDLNTVSESTSAQANAKTNLWNDRKFIRFVATNPQLTEYLVNPNALSKSAFDGEFVYVATVVAAHSENGSFFEGLTLNIDSRLKFEFSDNALSAYKLNEKLNPAGTRSPVVRYSADQFDIARSKNSYGDLTNTIAEQRDRPWSQRSATRINFARNDVAGYFNQFLGINNLYTNEFISSGSSLVGEVNTDTPGLIIFDTEEILTPNARSGNFGAGETGLDATTVTIRHAFLRVDQRNSTPKKYDEYDFQRFGLFRVDEYGLDENQRPTDQTLVKYARLFDVSENRQIVFVVSANYPAKYIDETQAVVDSWNEAFKAATGRDNVVVLKTKNEGEDFGDPRTNMIVYFDHRNESAPLGYGPALTDPKSGETISAKSYLYGDSIRWMRMVAGDYYDLIKGNRTGEEFMREGANGDFRQPLANRLSRLTAAAPTKSSIKPVDKSTAKTLAKSGIRSNYLATVQKLKANSNPEILGLLETEFGQALGKIGQNQSQLLDDLKAKHSRTSIDHNHGCMFRPDEHIASAAKFVRVFADKGYTKEQILDLVESRIVYTTLLHEVGHNLGLRHNFQGSFDEMNFHPEYFELKEKLASATPDEQVETPESYLEMYRTSSIMDYNDMFEATNTKAGPYDIAAIKYAYGDKLEVIDMAASQASGKLVTKDLPKAEYLSEVAALHKQRPDLHRRDIEAQLDRKLRVRPFMFCTDEHVENDPTCRRHDAGTTMAEVIENTVSGYDIGYILSGFRRNRRDFTGNSSSVIDRYIFPVRQMLDEYVYGIIFGTIPETGPASKEDYINAINIGLSFYLKVLNTPEPGRYLKDKESGVFVPADQASEGSTEELTVGTDVGKYIQASFETIGNEERATRRGTELDKAAVMMALAMRGYPAAKYERAGLALNFFDLAKDLTLDLFSKTMRGKGEASFKAAKTKQGKLIALTENRAAALSNIAQVQIETVKIKPSTSLFVESYSMIFAAADYNSASDRTFADYIDFRIVGENDQSLPANVERIQFTAANGLKKYVVPQTADGMSISYQIAKGADLSSQEMETSLAFVKDPKVNAAINAMSEALFDKVLAGYQKVYATVQGQEVPQEVVAELSSDKIAGLNRMLATISSIVEQATQIKTEAEAEGEKGQETVAAMEQILNAISEQQKTFVCDVQLEITEGAPLVCTAETLQTLNSEITAKNDKIETIQRQLRGIEADLIQLQQMYKMFN